MSFAQVYNTTRSGMAPKLMEFNNYLYLIGGAARVYRSASGAPGTWSEVADLTGEAAYGMAVMGNKLYVLVGWTGSRIWESSNGTSWTLKATIPDNYAHAEALQYFNGYLYLGMTATGGATVYRSNDAVNWTEVGSGLGDGVLKTAFVHDSYLYYGGAGAGNDHSTLWRTANGTSWTSVVAGISGKNVIGIGADASYIYVYEQDGKRLMRSSTGAASSWSEVETFTGVSDAQSERILLTNKGMYVSAEGDSGSPTLHKTSNGTDYTLMHTFTCVSGGIYGLFAYKSKLYVACYDGKVYVSSDTGYDDSLLPFRHPTNQGFGWQAAVHGIQNDPPA